jgi:aurora kinase
MPPERLNPKKRENPLHPSIDAWALGIMTYELLMGTIPYKATTRKSPEKSLLNEIYNADIIMDDYIPEEGKAFITNLLQLNPEKRMDNCTALEHPFLCQGSSSGWWHCPCK